MRLAKPFYLAMMAAPSVTDDLRAELIAAGRAATIDDVHSLLRAGAWRQVVMGAWFGLAVPAESVSAELVTAMSRSRGSLTAPPLAVTSAIAAGDTAVPAMTTYIDFILSPRHRDGSEGIVAAAIEFLGGQPVVAPTDEARRWFHDLCDFALELREAFICPRPTPTPPSP